MMFWSLGINITQINSNKQLFSKIGIYRNEYKNINRLVIFHVIEFKQTMYKKIHIIIYS